MAQRGKAYAASLFLNLVVLWAYQGASPSAPLKIDIDLSKPFATRSPWHFLASQEQSVTDSVSGTIVPGLIHLCLRAGPSAQCDPSVAIPQPPAPMPADAWEPHYLNHAGVVYSRGGASPLFLLRVASRHSLDGDQAIFTEVLAYHRSNDRFEQIYAHVTFRNNQEDRFITSGPLQGSVISVEPTSNAPFAYWVTVHELESTLMYK